MKKLISLILIIAIGIVWLKVDRAMEIEPYKKYSISFISTLKQNRALKAQTLLSDRLQYSVSVEDIIKFVHDTHIKKSKEIVWKDVTNDETHYTLLAQLQLEDQSSVAMEIQLTKATQGHITVERIIIGEIELQHTIDPKRAFFK